MKRIRTISVIVLCLLVMSSCKGLDTSENLVLALCGSYSVPGSFSAELKGGITSAEFLEKDEYGRTLFNFEAVNIVSGERENSLVICQQIDDEYVYFYEDISYCKGVASEEDIAALKSRNDWGNPLNMQLMSGRENLISFDLFIMTSEDRLYYGRVRESICKYLKIEKESLETVNFQDVSPNGHELYIVSTSSGLTTTYYIVILSSEYQVCALKEIQEIPSASEMAEMKSAAGWEYGWPD